MDRVLLDAFYELLRFEIVGEAITKKVIQIISEELISQLYKLSKYHDVAHLIGDALDKNRLLDAYPKWKKDFLQARNIAIYRCEQQQYEQERIFEMFETEKISFIPLKGSIIRKYYKESWMRTSCDIDILVHQYDLERATAALKTRLDYKMDFIGDHDASFLSESGLHLELHYRLVDEEAKQAEKTILDGVWEHVAHHSSTEQHYYIMEDDYFYAYYISHMAKHLRFGGSGVRSILDVWILNNIDGVNSTERKFLLQKVELGVLAEAVEKLARVWLFDEEADELTERLNLYILSGGTYGSFNNKVEAMQSRKKNSHLYLLSRVFPSYSMMVIKYPRLKKIPILYPYYIGKRWCKLLNRRERNKAFQEIESVHNLSRQENGVAKLLNDLGL